MMDESLQCSDISGEMRAASQTAGAAKRLLQVSTAADPSRVSEPLYSKH